MDFELTLLKNFKEPITATRNMFRSIPEEATAGIMNHHDLRDIFLERRDILIKFYNYSPPQNKIEFDELIGENTIVHSFNRSCYIDRHINERKFFI